MSTPTDRLDRVIAAIDAANAGDPRRVRGQGGDDVAREVIYARRMSMRLASLYPEASEVLQIAARAQHLRRWEIARSTYPEGRVGYNDWRKACREHHGRLAGEIMRAHGYGAGEVERVGQLIRKEQLKKDKDSQALENVVAVVFLEHELEEFLAKHPDYDDAKHIDILGKTLRKMSPKGHAAALALSLSARAQALVKAAVEREAATLARLAEVAID